MYVDLLCLFSGLHLSLPDIYFRHLSTFEIFCTNPDTASHARAAGAACAQKKRTKSSNLGQRTYKAQVLASQRQNVFMCGSGAHHLVAWNDRALKSMFVSPSAGCWEDQNQCCSANLNAAGLLQEQLPTKPLRAC